MLLQKATDTVSRLFAYLLLETVQKIKSESNIVTPAHIKNFGEPSRLKYLVETLQKVPVYRYA